ncbi:hypothetical protein J4465_00870 [Candidatus Pacearchaeota archaeon]|nr:hypothetical protein [Candidatus Pacearchaeota archaeon]
MNLTKNILVFVSFLFLALAFVGYANAEFYIATNITTNTVCPSNTIVLTTSVSTTTPGAFTVTQSGSAANFATTVPSGFYLEPYQNNIVYTYLTPSTKFSPGLYYLDLQIASNGQVRTSHQLIVVENCHNTELIAEPTTQTICSCEQKFVKYTLYNKGKYIENYKISADGIAAAWTNLSLTELTIPGNSSREFFAYISTPCNTIGRYELNVVAKSESEYSQTNAKSSFNTVSCYDYTVIPEKYFYSVCENEKLVVPITLANNGVKNNNYKINLDAPTWATIDQKELNIPVNSSKTLNLLVQPPFKTIGNYTAKIDVLSTEGKIIKKQEITIESKNCYGVYTEIQSTKDRMCNALTKTYSVLIKNTGKFQNTYDLVLDAPNWVTLSEKHFTLNTSGEKQITLDVHPPYNSLPATSEIKIIAIDKISNYSASHSLSLSTISVEDCYKPQISSQLDEIDIARDSTGTVIFVIENKGINEANYTLEVSGTATQFAELNPGTVTIKPAKAQTVYLYLSPSPEVQLGNYSLTVSARLKDTTIVSTKNLNVFVTKEVGVKPITNETNQTVKTTERNFFQKIGDWFVSIFQPTAPKTQIENKTVSNNTNISKPITNTTKPVNTTNLSTNATVNTTSTAKVTTNTSITGNTITNTTNTTNTTLPVNTTNITTTNTTEVNTTITNVTKNTTKETIQPILNQTAPILNKQIPSLNIKKGEQIVLDLSTYFEDPQNEKLTFVTIKPSNFEVQINNSKATIVPVANYSGIVDMTFYASNGKEITASNKFNVSVNDNPTTVIKEEKITTNTTNFFDLYKYYIIAAIIVIVILAIVLSGAGKKVVDFFAEDDEEK